MDGSRTHGGAWLARFIRHDVTVPDDWVTVVADVLEHEGTIDGLVNNAGMHTFSPVQTEPLEHFNTVVATNLTGAFLGMQAAIPVLTERGRGSIVNVSSSGGLMGLPTTGSYAASKWGLRGLTKVAALELARRGIRVNSVHPGMVYTPMTSESAGIVEGPGNYPACPMHRLLCAPPAHHGLDLWLANIPQPRTPRECWPEHLVFQMVRDRVSASPYSREEFAHIHYVQADLPEECGRRPRTSRPTNPGSRTRTGGRCSNGTGPTSS